MPHFVVLNGLNDGKSSEYTIQATGDIEMVEGELGGVPVVRDSDAPVEGSRVDGTVWAKADGFHVYGGIKSIEIDSPDNVELHVGQLAGSQNGDSTEECEMEVRAKSVEVLQGQGFGEGALELEITHNIHGAQSQSEPRTRVPVGSSVNLGTSIDAFKVQRGSSETRKLTTKVTEKEVPGDALTGQDDFGEDTMDITLNCDEPQEVSQTVNIGSDRGNPGKVRVNYVIGNLSG